MMSTRLQEQEADSPPPQMQPVGPDSLCCDSPPPAPQVTGCCILLCLHQSNCSFRSRQQQRQPAGQQTACRGIASLSMRIRQLLWRCRCSKEAGQAAGRAAAQARTPLAVRRQMRRGRPRSRRPWLSSLQIGPPQPTLVCISSCTWCMLVLSGLHSPISRSFQGRQAHMHYQGMSNDSMICTFGGLM